MMQRREHDQLTRREAMSSRLRFIEAPDVTPSLFPSKDPQDEVHPKAPRVGQPIEGMHDPRWVLAVRTAEVLDGPVLAPQKRERLVRLGKVLGLSPFDANLVIAIVQDQARRGFAPEYCPTAGEPQLRMVPLPCLADTERAKRAKRVMRICFIITSLIGLELVVLKWFFS